METGVDGVIEGVIEIVGEGVWEGVLLGEGDDLRTMGGMKSLDK